MAKINMAFHANAVPIIVILQVKPCIHLIKFMVINV